MANIDEVTRTSESYNDYDSMSRYMNYIRAMGKEILLPIKCKCGSYLFKLIKKEDRAVTVCKKCGNRRYIDRDRWDNYKIDREVYSYEM